MSIRSDADPQYCQIRVVHCSYNHDVWAWASSSKFLYDGSRSPGRSLKRSSFSEKKGKLMPYRYRPYCSQSQWFNTDPDTADLTIGLRIWIVLFSSVALQMPTKCQFFPSYFFAYYIRRYIYIVLQRQQVILCLLIEYANNNGSGSGRPKKTCGSWSGSLVRTSVYHPCVSRSSFFFFKRIRNKGVERQCPNTFFYYFIDFKYVVGCSR